MRTHIRECARVGQQMRGCRRLLGILDGLRVGDQFQGIVGDGRLELRYECSLRQERFRGRPCEAAAGYEPAPLLPRNAEIVEVGDAARFGPQAHRAGLAESGIQHFEQAPVIEIDAE